MHSSFPMISGALMIPGCLGLLEACVDVPKNVSGDGIAIVCHPHPLHGGTMDNKVVTTVSRAFQDCLLPVVRFNYRGVGGSAGSYGALAGECDDMLSVMEWVKQARPRVRFYLAGFSFGAYVASRAAVVNGCERLILVAPPVNHLPFHKIDYTSLAVAVIMGERDEIVPPQAVYDWVEGLKKPPTLVRMPDTSHFFHGKLNSLKKHVIELLSPL